MADGDNLQLGNGNDAQTPTVIEARRRDGVSFFFLGRAIFEAGPSAPPDVPAQQFMGVLGRGADAHPDNLNPGMPGVAGYGGRPSGGRRRHRMTNRVAAALWELADRRIVIV